MIKEMEEQNTEWKKLADRSKYIVWLVTMDVPYPKKFADYLTTNYQLRRLCG
jgi:hypothetical protein